MPKRSSTAFIRSPEFITKCLAGFRKFNIPNLSNMYQRVEAGELLTQADLKAMGYDYWNSRNIAAYISDECFDSALGWE
jgi:hypothetical protein